MARRPRQEELDRKEMIARKIEEGFSNRVDIAKALHGKVRFDGSFNNTYSCVNGYFRRNGLLPPVEAEKLASLTSHIPAQKNPRRIEAFIQQYQIRLPAGHAGEFDRFVRALVSVTRAVETEAGRVPELEARVRELERHRCPDADTALHGENEQLKDRIAFLEKRVEALSRLTAPRPLTDAHMGINGGR